MEFESPHQFIFQFEKQYLTHIQSEIIRITFEGMNQSIWYFKINTQSIHFWKIHGVWHIGIYRNCQLSAFCRATKMKFVSLLTLSYSLFVVSAFRPNPAKKSAALNRKDSAVQSALFSDPLHVRGGAVPGWAAYNEALDKNPLTAKACTSLVGWALGDFLAQVRTEWFENLVVTPLPL